MHPQEGDELEQRLRAAFEPKEAAVRRVIAAAMQPRRRRPAALSAAAAFTAVCAALVWLFFTRQPAPVHAESIRLEYIGTVALIEFPDGSSWVVSPDAASQGPNTQLNLIIYGGDEP